MERKNATALDVIDYLVGNPTFIASTDVFSFLCLLRRFVPRDKLRSYIQRWIQQLFLYSKLIVELVDDRWCLIDNYNWLPVSFVDYLDSAKISSSVVGQDRMDAVNYFILDFTDAVCSFYYSLVHDVI